MNQQTTHFLTLLKWHLRHQGMWRLASRSDAQQLAQCQEAGVLRSRYRQCGVWIERVETIVLCGPAAERILCGLLTSVTHRHTVRTQVTENNVQNSTSSATRHNFLKYRERNSLVICLIFWTKMWQISWVRRMKQRTCQLPIQMEQNLWKKVVYFLLCR